VGVGILVGPTDLNEWFEKNLERIKAIIISTLSKLSHISIAIIFDPECAKCDNEEKTKECFIPFLTSVKRIKLMLYLIILGVFYNQLKAIGIQTIMTKEIFEEIASLHEDFAKWKSKNCSLKKKGEK
jgi:hypothetical protein